MSAAELPHIHLHVTGHPDTPHLKTWGAAVVWKQHTFQLAGILHSPDHISAYLDAAQQMKAMNGLFHVMQESVREQMKQNGFHVTRTRIECSSALKLAQQLAQITLDIALERTLRIGFFTTYQPITKHLQYATEHKPKEVSLHFQHRYSPTSPKSVKVNLKPQSEAEQITRIHKALKQHFNLSEEEYLEVTTHLRKRGLLSVQERQPFTAQTSKASQGSMWVDFSGKNITRWPSTVTWGAYLRLKNGKTLTLGGILPAVSDETSALKAACQATMKLGFDSLDVYTDQRGLPSQTFANFKSLTWIKRSSKEQQKAHQFANRYRKTADKEAWFTTPHDDRLQASQHKQGWIIRIETPQFKGQVTTIGQRKDILEQFRMFLKSTGITQERQQALLNTAKRHQWRMVPISERHNHQEERQFTLSKADYERILDPKQRDPNLEERRQQTLERIAKQHPQPQDGKEK